MTNVFSDDRSESFHIHAGLTVEGGYRGRTAPSEADGNWRDIETYATTLDGDIDQDDSGFTNNADNAYHVVTLSGGSGTATVDGVIVRGGHTYDSMSSPGNEDAGAGLLVAAGVDAVVTDCIFRFNRATDSGTTASGAGVGGAIHCASSDLLLTGCFFEDNETRGEAAAGGAVHGGQQLTIQFCTFSANFADSLDSCDGGAVWSTGALDVSDSVFLYNTILAANDVTDDQEGGGAISANAPAVVTRCVFEGNQAPRGGACVFYTDREVSLCRFIDNVAADYNGGAIWIALTAETRIESCEFIGNLVSAEPCDDDRGHGGAIALYHSAPEICGDPCPEFEVLQCTFADNHAQGRGGAIAYIDSNLPIKINNTIFWGNSADDGSELGEHAQIDDLTQSFGLPSDEFEIAHSDIDGADDYTIIASVIGDNLPDDDPQFVIDGFSRHRLGGGTRCIDAGNTLIAPDEDLDLRARLKDDPDQPRFSEALPPDENCIVDMGAYEFINDGYCGCPGDENEDCIVDFDDLNNVLGNFFESCDSMTNPPDPGCPGDENEDGVVNFTDHNRVLGNFGNECTACELPEEELMDGGGGGASLLTVGRGSWLAAPPETNVPAYLAELGFSGVRQFADYVGSLAPEELEEFMDELLLLYGQFGE